MISCYHDYVNHMLRQYFARDQSFPPGSVASTNCAVCQSIVSSLPADQTEILRDVFSAPDQPIAPLVEKCAEQHKMREVIVWKTIRAVSKQIARQRGLID